MRWTNGLYRTRNGIEVRIDSHFHGFWLESYNKPIPGFEKYGKSPRWELTGNTSYGTWKADQAVFKFWKDGDYRLVPELDLVERIGE